MNRTPTGTVLAVCASSTVLYPRGIPIIIKDEGCSSGILERNSKRNQDPVLCAWLEMFLAPMKDIPILKQNIISSFFSAYALKGTAKAFTVNLNTLYQNRVFTPSVL